MPTVIVACAEGEHALYANPLGTLGNNDDKHRGSVTINNGDSLFYDAGTQSSDDMWFHVLLARNDAGGNGGSAQTFINIFDGNNRFMAGVRDNDLDFVNTFAFRTRWASTPTSGDNSQGPFTYTFPNQDFVEFDFRLRISTVTDTNDTLTIDWYLNQQLRETEVITNAAGWGRAERITINALHTGSGRDTCALQDVIVTDGVPTVGMELVTMQPAATGFYSAWTNNYTNIDEPGYSADDLIFATTAGVRESWICVTPTFDTSDKIIYAFCAMAVVQTDLANVVSDFRSFLRIGAVDYDGDLLGADNLSPKPLIHLWTENPSTTAPWAQSDFDGLEVGILTT